MIFFSNFIKNFMTYFFKFIYSFLKYTIILINLAMFLGCSSDSVSREESVTYFDVTLKVEGLGEVTPETGVFLKNSLILFKATPLDGYYFDHWLGFDNQVESYEHEFLLTRNLILTAVFLPIPELSDEVIVFDPKNIDPNPVFMIENGGKSAYLNTKKGERLKTWDFDLNLGNDLKLMPDGSIIGIFKPENVSFSFGGYGGILRKYNPDGALAWEYEVNNKTELMHHDFDVLPNGNILILVWEKFSEDRALNFGFSGSGPIYLEKLIELNTESQTIVWEWRSADHLIQDFEQSSSNFGSVTEHPEKIDLNYHENENGDLMHANGLYYDPKRDVIFVSVNFYSEVWVIPHQFDTIKSKTELGDLVFRFGNPNAYGGSGDRLFFNNHHPSLVTLDPESIDNFLIYMNGYKNEQSKVYEFLLPSVFDSNPLNWNSPEIIWSYTDPELFFGKISGAYRLPNGNTLICEGDFGYWEVTHSGKIVWKFDGGTTFWRGYVYPNFIL